MNAELQDLREQHTNRMSPGGDHLRQASRRVIVPSRSPGY